MHEEDEDERDGPFIGESCFDDDTTAVETLQRVWEADEKLTDKRGDLRKGVVSF